MVRETGGWDSAREQLARRLEGLDRRAEYTCAPPRPPTIPRKRGFRASGRAPRIAPYRRFTPRRLHGANESLLNIINF